MRPLREGDVFEIPIGEGRSALGQIITFLAGTRIAFLMVGYPGAYPPGAGGVAVDDILREPPIIEALTTYIPLRQGRWRVVANRPLPGGYVKPLFRIGGPGGDEVVDHNLDRVQGRHRAAGQAKAHTTFAAPTIERCLAAACGLGSHAELDDRLVIPEARRSCAPARPSRWPWHRA
jgi:hypothetical protein